MRSSQKADTAPTSRDTKVDRRNAACPTMVYFSAMTRSVLARAGSTTEELQDVVLSDAVQGNQGRPRTE